MTEPKQKKKLHCTNRNHLAAFKYSIEPDLEMIDECLWEEYTHPSCSDMDCIDETCTSHTSD